MVQTGLRLADHVKYRWLKPGGDYLDANGRQTAPPTTRLALYKTTQTRYGR